MQPFRIQPQMQVGAYKTYQIAAPLATHFRAATCEEVGCQPHIHGWATTVMYGSKDEAAVRGSGRHFTEERQEGGFVRFVFPPGQPCFAASRHKVPLEREAIFVVRDGDWRRLGPARRHANAIDWRDDFGEHQERLADRLAQG